MLKTAEAWLARLEDPETPQSRGSLYRIQPDERPVGFCCLGVAADICPLVEWKFLDNLAAAQVPTDTEIRDAHYMPLAVADWLGIKQQALIRTSRFAVDIRVFRFGDRLSTLNDKRVPFSKIAALLRENEEFVFLKTPRKKPRLRFS